MSNVAVTGGTGFVGSNLVRRLLKEEHHVCLLNRPGYRDWRIESLRGQCDIHELDFTQPQAVADALGRIRPEVVFHLAAHGAYSWQTNPLQIVQTNYLGTVNLALACEAAEVRTFVHAGSSSEYGLKKHAAKEDDCPEPNSDYAAAKVAATLFCQSRARRSGRPMPTLRLYSVYGPYEEPNRLMSRLVCSALEGALPPLASPRTARDFVYVEDVVDAFMAAGFGAHEDAGAIYNIGSGQQTALAEVVEVARRVLDIRAQPEWGSMANRQWDTDVWYGDVQKAKGALGWQARTSLEEGLRRFMEWMRKTPGMIELYRRQLADEPGAS